jgi:hypothetical protein
MADGHCHSDRPRDAERGRTYPRDGPPTRTDGGRRERDRETDPVETGDATVDRPLVALVRDRAKLVFGAGLVGGVVGVLATVVVFVAIHPDDLQRASARSFALAAIALGFGVLGWSGSIFAGRGFEAMQEHLETGTNWTERDSRRAMARISGFGAGAMIGVVVATTLLGGVG